MDHIIRDYLLKHNMTGAEFARKIGISNTHLQYIYKRERYPSRFLCQKIYDYTNGEISVSDLLDIKEIKEPKK